MNKRYYVVMEMTFEEKMKAAGPAIEQMAVAFRAVGEAAFQAANVLANHFRESMTHLINQAGPMLLALGTAVEDYEQRRGLAWYDCCIYGRRPCGQQKNRLTRAEQNRYDAGEWPYQYTGER